MKEDKKIVDFEFLRKSAILIIWVVIITLVFIKRESITLESIVSYSPENTFVAVAVMLSLFLLKSISFFIYGGLLYAASGVIFPFPLAIVVNAVGTVIMCSVPFFIGRKAGTPLLERLFKKHTKLQIIKYFQENNEFFVSFFTRIVGILPADIVSMYMGASRTKYKNYLSGTILGLLPSMITFCIMGMKADDVSSPAFILSALFELLLMVASVVYVFLWQKKHKKNEEKK